MKRFCLLLLAASSFLLTARAASRPHYGGTLRIAVRQVPNALDPASLAVFGPAGLSSLIFETLTTIDDRGRVQPLLATSWQPQPGNQRWHFTLRRNVSFADGTALDANAAAASLRTANPEWRVQADGDSVMIGTSFPDPDLPAELALARNGIWLRNGASVNGTGPFTVSQWDPAKHLVLVANERYHEGRPFIDSVEITFGRNDREQMTLLDLNRADVIQMVPETIRRAQTGGRTVLASQPQELVAVVFPNDPKSDDETRARRALATSIDTTALNNVVLQGGGEPTSALLPNWLSGYAFAIPAGAADLAQRERIRVQHPVSWRLAYDSADPLARIIAERILLNARDVGITLQLATSSTADLHLACIPLTSYEPQVALRELAKSLQLPEPKFSGSSINDLYSAELNLLQTGRVIPLLYLRSAVSVRPNVQEFSLKPNGAWQLNEVWLAAEKP